MNKAFCIALAAAIAVLLHIPQARSEEESSEVEYYRNFAEQQLAAARSVPVPQAADYDDARDNALKAIPRYYHSRSDDEMSKSRANGAGVSVVYTRRVTDWFSFGLLYEYALLDVRGGGDSRWDSHTAGVLSRFDLACFGKLELALTQSFDRAEGYEESGAARRDIDGYGADATSLMAWWEKDFAIGCTGWSFSPHAGWRSVYSDTKDGNDWPTGNKDDSFWTHLASAGAKVSFESGRFGLSFRGGVSHRVTDDDVLLFGNREVAPGVTLFSHRANLDRTVGAVGAELKCRVNDCAAISLGYDGMFGKDTDAHAGSVKFALSF